MTLDMSATPVVSAAPSTAPVDPDPARAGVLWELTGGGRFTDLAEEDLVPFEEEWPFLKALWRIDPKLVWIASWSMGYAEGEPDLAHPVRELRRRVARRGVGRSAFERLAGEANAGALLAFEFLGSSILEAHLRLETLLGRALPWEGPAAEWIHRFIWRPGADHFDLERSRIEFTLAQGAYLARTGLARIAAGTDRGFNMVELPLVLRYWSETVRGDQLPRWKNLVARAREAHAAAVAEQRAKGCRWDSGMTSTDLGGYRIHALSDSYALWREGLSMRHCIADYADPCTDDGVRVFHLQSQSSRASWTLALAPNSEDTWRVHEMRGPRNQLPDADARAVAHAWALAYGDIFPPGEHGLAPLEEDMDEEQRCPICRVPDCQTHLVATVELDEGLMGGCLYDDWGARERHIQAELLRAVLNGRPDPEWPSEIASLYDALHAVRDQFVVRDHTGESDAPWIIDDDAYADACTEIGTERLLLNYLEEWLDEQPGTVSNAYEISTAPGLSWSGTMVYADDPDAVRRRFRDEFCVLRGPKPQVRA